MEIKVVGHDPTQKAETYMNLEPLMVTPEATLPIGTLILIGGFTWRIEEYRPVSELHDEGVQVYGRRLA